MEKIYDEISYIFYNGNILTADENHTVSEALAVRGEKIYATGSNEDILKLKTESTRLIDCMGNTLMPGIIDSHTHLWEYGILSEGVILFGLTDMKELRAKLAEKVSTLKKGDWIQGGSWIETQFKENRMPTRYDLDPVSPENPVVFERIFGACVVNSRALEIAGIDKNTPDPANGEIQRDSVSKEPTGVLLGQAVLLIREHIPGIFGSDDFGSGKGEAECEAYEKFIIKAMPEYLSYGITSIVEPGVSPQVMKSYQNIRERGELLIRVNLLPNWHGYTLKQQTEKMDRYVEDSGVYTGFGDEWLRLGGLKMAIDGGLTSKTALLSWAYKGEEKPREVTLRLDTGRLEEWMSKAHDAGWSIGIHVMGDLAIEMAVDAIYKAYKKNPVKRQHHLIHAYYPTKECLEKMREAGIMVAVQSAFTYGEADGYVDLLDEDKRETFLPLRTYLDNGITVSLSSDTPCAAINPFWGLYSAVTRKGVQGYCLGTGECVTVMEGIKMLTIQGARITNEQQIKGSLEPGKLADICLLDRNVQDCREEELRDLCAALTMVGGRIVYQR